MLEPGVKPLEQRLGRGQGAFGERPHWGLAGGNILRLTLGLAQHAGDWNSSPTALNHLAMAFKERSGLPEVEAKVVTLRLTDARALAACKLVLITSNDPVVFTREELDGLRGFLQRGGVAWINDSSATSDARFDAALRRTLAAEFAATKLETLGPDHALFRAAYDLSRGYKGYKVPPGDKYRQEFLEGLALAPGGRTAIVYTRNDYADGLEIDPRNIAGRPSLTDLAPEEMLEGSLRFGINLIAYALGSEAPRLPPPPESVAQFEKLYRYSGPELPAFDDFEQAADAEGVPAWRAEDWGNAVTAASAPGQHGRALKVVFKGGDKAKAAVGRNVELDLANAKALVLDLHSSMKQGFNVAILYQTRPDWTGFESRPVFVRPGANKNLRFPLALDDFKSSKTDWKQYDTAFKPRGQVSRITILLYNLENNGEVSIDNLRIEK